MTAEASAICDPSDLERELLSLVEEQLLDGADGLDVTTPLSEVGIDSMAVMQLLLLIEERFALWLPEQDLTHENFASIRSLARVVAQRLAERDGVR